MEDTPIKIALERDHTEIAVMLCEAIGEEIPDKVKLELLSKAIYKEDNEEAKKVFSEILATLSPHVVRFRSKQWIITWFIVLGEQYSCQ